ncbi:MAG TPA: tRNA pseudouridine(13) synthase TruD [Gemmataceae bacterium]|nr:tRNA pseudouridine(13) synthase TruD [Gemmataceae bacterium]
MASLIPPLLTPDLPGIGGRIKVQLDDFDVEEIPAYEPDGSGDHLFLRIEKCDMGAEFFARQIAKRLGISPGEVGTAGLKDRRAVTRQWVSAPAAVEPRLDKLEGDGIRVLRVSRHTNKLRPGHLRGNRFRIMIRDVPPNAAELAAPILDRIRRDGLPNFYGPQRFGRDGETARLGLDLLQGDHRSVRNPFLRKLALSAAQSVLFNDYLGRRLTDGLLRAVLAGDVMAKWPAGGMFVARDVATEQARFDARETVHAGPMFGKKTFAAEAVAAEREAAVLRDAGLTAESFAGFGKLLMGTRRHNLVYEDDLAAESTADGLRLTFTLPAGSYATVLLREVMKRETGDQDAGAADDLNSGE